MSLVLGAGFALAILSTILIIIALVQLRRVQATLAGFSGTKTARDPTRAAHERAVETIVPKLEELENRLDRVVRTIASEVREIESQLGRFDIVFSDIRAQLAALQPAGPANGTGASAVVGAVREAANPAARPSGGEVLASTWRSSEELQSGEPALQVPTPQPTESEYVAKPLAYAPGRSVGSDAAENLSSIIEQYRELISQPRKSEINRWSDEVGGQSCEITDEGTIRPLSRDNGGLLILLTIDGVSGVVVPGGRLVVDFPTSFANVMSMRRITRDSFELVNDGSGVLRVLEPAIAERKGDKWQLVHAGSLSGLKSE